MRREGHLKGNRMSRGLEVTGYCQDLQLFSVTESKSIKLGLMGNKVAQGPIREGQSPEILKGRGAIMTHSSMAIKYLSEARLLLNADSGSYFISKTT